MTSETSLGARILEAVRSGKAAKNARLAAARGVLPLEPAELVRLQIELLADPEPEIVAAAQASLGALGQADAAALAADPATATEVLAFFAAYPTHFRDAATVLAGSRRIPAAALRTIASSSLPDAVARLVGNQEALGTDPELGALLAANPALAGADRQRLLDYLDELAKQKAPAPAAAGAPDAALDTPADLAPARDPFLAALGIDAEVEALLPQLDFEFGLGELADRSELLGELEDADDSTLYQKLQTMKVGQKLRLALFGGQEARLLLIRDSNRLVSCAVVKNPKFTVNEAEFAAKSRNVNQDVYRLIARHRDFSQLYAIQIALVKNPRCPADLALGYVPQLNDRDLKLMLKNRNVGEAIRRTAKKIIEAREARRRVRLVPGKH